MATKKQKRQAVAERRALFDADVREKGLQAQAKDRELRQRKAQRAKDEAERDKRRDEAIRATEKLKNTSLATNPLERRAHDG